MQTKTNYTSAGISHERKVIDRQHKMRLRAIDRGYLRGEFTADEHRRAQRWAIEMRDAYRDRLATLLSLL